MQRRFGFAEGTVELYAEKVNNRGLCAIAQCESLRYKLLGGLAVRRYVVSADTFHLEAYDELSCTSGQTIVGPVCTTPADYARMDAMVLVETTQLCWARVSRERAATEAVSQWVTRVDPARLSKNELTD